MKFVRVISTVRLIKNYIYLYNMDFSFFMKYTVWIKKKRGFFFFLRLYPFIKYIIFIYNVINLKWYTGIDQYLKYIVSLAKPVQPSVQYWLPCDQLAVSTKICTSQLSLPLPTYLSFAILNPFALEYQIVFSNKNGITCYVNFTTNC